MPTDADSVTSRRDRATGNSGDGDEQRSKRAKRGRYVLKAW